MAEYYHKFVKNHGKVTTPLTTFLNKDALICTLNVIKAFEHIKEAMCQDSVLATPNFKKTLIVESNASGNDIGIMLMQ